MRDFWSARRAAVREEEAREAIAASEAAIARAEEERAARLSGMNDAELCAELGLPDIETLGPGDDFSAFMREAVPAHLRRLALRRLWGTNPVLANLDGMVDYGCDFTDASRCRPDLRSAYEVGKGLMRHVEAMAAEAEVDAAPASPDAAEAATDMPVDEAAPAGEAPVQIGTTTAPAADGASATEVEEFAPRHMRFDYGETR